MAKPEPEPEPEPEPNRAPRAVVIIPGRGYGPDAPLLDYARWAAFNRGGEVSSVRWSALSGDSPDDLVALPAAERGAAVCAQVVPFLDAVTAPDAVTALDAVTVHRPLLIGKSLGTHAAALAADRELPAVWLTPLLHSAWVVDALRRSRAPFLLIGGTADRAWDSTVARDLTPHILEIDGANHGMFVLGPLAGSAAVLGQVATAIERFLDEIVWPAG